jgi:hypothetical protein
MSEKIEGQFEVVEIEDGKITVRHLATQHDFELDLPEGSAEKFRALLPLGTYFEGSMEIEHVHFC